MKVNILAATQTVEKTMPFVFYRWLVFLGLTFGFVFAALAGAGTAIAVSSFSSDPTFFANFGAVIGCASFGWLLYTFRRSIANEVSFPHLLLLGKVVRGDAIPPGKDQVLFAKQELAKRFPTTAEPHVLSSKIGGTLRALPHLSGINLRPTRTDRLATILDQAVARISGLNTDVVMARTATDEGRGIWSAAQFFILQQAPELRTYLVQRATLTLFEIIGWMVSFAVLLVPILKIAAALPFPTTFWPYVIAGIFSWNLKASFLEPISQAAMIRLDMAVEKDEAAQDVAARLADSIGDFRDIVARSVHSP